MPRIFDNMNIWIVPVWVIVYALLMATIVVQMTTARHRAQNTPESKQTEPWAVNQDVPAPRGMQRGMLHPQRLLEDHFEIYLAALIVFTTLVYGVTMFLFCGATLGKKHGPVTLEQELNGSQDQDHTEPQQE